MKRVHALWTAQTFLHIKISAIPAVAALLQVSVHLGATPAYSRCEKQIPNYAYPREAHLKCSD